MNHSFIHLMNISDCPSWCWEFFKKNIRLGPGFQGVHSKVTQADIPHKGIFRRLNYNDGEGNEAFWDYLQGICKSP